MPPIKDKVQRHASIFCAVAKYEGDEPGSQVKVDEPMVDLLVWRAIAPATKIESVKEVVVES